MLHSALPPRERARAPGGGCARARSASRSARARRCSRRCGRSAWWSSTRSTTLVQAGGGGALPRARPGAGAGAAGRRGGASSARRRRRWRARTTSTRGRFSRLLAARARHAAAAARRSTIVDLRRHPPGPDGLLSAPLADALGATLAAGEQTILFLNRRGFSTVVLCRACGHVVRCANCSVSLTYHRGAVAPAAATTAARTHAVPARCPRASAPRLERLGMAPSGSRRWCASASPTRAWPGSIATPRRGERRSAARLLDADPARACRRGEIDILVGTQMVTKGHDFPGVTLVGVLLPDQAMHLPDFRAAERTFQLLEQVAGRAGRGDRPGRVIVQTYTPEHPAIAAVRAPRLRGLRARASSPSARASRLPAVRAHGRAAPRRARRGAGARPAPRRRAGGGARGAGGPAVRCSARRRRRSRGCAAAPAGRSGCRRTSARRWRRRRARRPRGSADRGDLRLAVDVDPQSVL